MSLHNDITSLNKTIENLTSTQKKRLYEYEQKNKIQYYFTNFLYNCYYVKNIDIYSMQTRDPIIDEFLTKHKTRLYNDNITKCYILEIYTKTAKTIPKKAEPSNLPNHLYNNIILKLIAIIAGLAMFIVLLILNFTKKLMRI